MQLAASWPAGMWCGMARASRDIPTSCPGATSCLQTPWLLVLTHTPSTVLCAGVPLVASDFPFFVGIFGLLALPPWSCPSVLQHNSLKKLLKATQVAAETKPQLLVSESPESPPAPPGSCLPSTLSHVGAPQQPRGARCSPRAHAGGVTGRRLAGAVGDGEVGVQGAYDLVLTARASPLADLGVRSLPRLVREPCPEGGQEHPAAAAGAGGHMER